MLASVSHRFFNKLYDQSPAAHFVLLRETWDFLTLMDGAPRVAFLLRKANFTIRDLTSNVCAAEQTCLNQRVVRQGTILHSLSISWNRIWSGNFRLVLISWRCQAVISWISIAHPPCLL